MQAETTAALQRGKNCTNKLCPSAASSSSTALLYHQGSIKQSAPSKVSTAFGSEAGLGSLSWAPIFHNVMHHLMLLKMKEFHALCTQTGPDKHESCWRQARSGRSFAPCPDLTSSLGGNGAPDNPLLSPLGYRTRGTFLLQEYGLLAAVTPVEMDDAVMKRLFWDECCHSSQVEFWEGRYTRLCSWGKCMSRRRAALVRRRGELQATSFAVRECRYKPSHLNTPEEIDEGWRHR